MLPISFQDVIEDKDKAIADALFVSLAEIKYTLQGQEVKKHEFFDLALNVFKKRMFFNGFIKLGDMKQSNRNLSFTITLFDMMQKQSVDYEAQLSLGYLGGNK